MEAIKNEEEKQVPPHKRLMSFLGNDAAVYRLLVDCSFFPSVKTERQFRRSNLSVNLLWLPD